MLSASQKYKFLLKKIAILKQVLKKLGLKDKEIQLDVFEKSISEPNKKLGTKVLADLVLDKNEEKFNIEYSSKEDEVNIFIKNTFNTAEELNSFNNIFVFNDPCFNYEKPMDMSVFSKFIDTVQGNANKYLKDLTPRASLDTLKHILKFSKEEEKYKQLSEEIKKDPVNLIIAALKNEQTELYCRISTPIVDIFKILVTAEPTYKLACSQFATDIPFFLKEKTEILDKQKVLFKQTDKKNKNGLSFHEVWKKFLLSTTSIFTTFDFFIEAMMLDLSDRKEEVEELKSTKEKHIKEAFLFTIIAPIVTMVLEQLKNHKDIRNDFQKDLLNAFKLLLGLEVKLDQVQLCNDLIEIFNPNKNQLNDEFRKIRLDLTKIFDKTKSSSSVDIKPPVARLRKKSSEKIIPTLTSMNSSLFSLSRSMSPPKPYIVSPNSPKNNTDCKIIDILLHRLEQNDDAVKSLFNHNKVVTFIFSECKQSNDDQKSLRLALELVNKIDKKTLEILFKNDEARDFILKSLSQLDGKKDKEKFNGMIDKLGKLNNQILLLLIKTRYEQKEPKSVLENGRSADDNLDIALLRERLQKDETFVKEVSGAFKSFFDVLKIKGVLEIEQGAFKKITKIKEEYNNKAKEAFLTCIAELGKIFATDGSLPNYCIQLLTFTRQDIENKLAQALIGESKQKIEQESKTRIIYFTLFRMIIAVLPKIQEKEFPDSPEPLKLFLESTGTLAQMVKDLGKAYKKYLLPSDNKQDKNKRSSQDCTAVSMLPTWFDNASATGVLSSKATETLVNNILSVCSGTVALSTSNQESENSITANTLIALLQEQKSSKVAQEIVATEQSIKDLKDKVDLLNAVAPNFLTLKNKGTGNNNGNSNNTSMDRVLNGKDNNAEEIRQFFCGAEKPNVEEKTAEYKKSIEQYEAHLELLQKEQQFYAQCIQKLNVGRQRSNTSYTSVPTCLI